MASNRTHDRGLWRRLLWWPLAVLLALFLASVMQIYQRGGYYDIDIGALSDEAYTLNFHGRLADNAPSYRWSDVYGYVTLPGMGGSRPFSVTITIDPGRAAPVELFVNGEQFFASTLDAGWRTLDFRVDEQHPQALQSRDTVIEFRSTDYRTEDNAAEPKGMKVDRVVVQQDESGDFVVPAIAPVAWLVVSLVLIYGLVCWWVSAFVSIERSRVYGLLAAAVLALGSLVVLSESRIFVGAAAPHVATTLLSVLAISVGIEAFFKWRNILMSPRLVRALSGVVGLAFLLRFGAMALPQSVIVDMPYHMKWLRQLLTGDWQSLYFPGGLSAVPREWGMELLIPKSPLFYFAFAPLAVLPFDLESATKWLISLLDASVVVAVYWLARKSGIGAKGALAAGFLYAVMPLAFRAFSYGILPTIFAQWLAVLLFVLLLTASERRAGVGLWFAVGLVGTLTLLAFPTVAVFVTLVIGGYMLLLYVKPRSLEGSSAGYGWRVPTMLAIAWALAIISYYGLYAEPVAASVGALISPSNGQSDTVRWPGGVPDLLAWTADYVVTLLPAVLAVVGLWLLGRRGVRAEQRRVFALLIVWAAIAPIFLLANYKFDMIGKHLFFVMAPVAIVGGAALLAYSRRGRWGGLLAGLALGLIAWQGLTFWVERLVRQSS